MNSSRLLSLDVLRGLTVALMILVNNGAGHEHFHQLTHSQWNGLTLCDIVFPFFLFMVGVSISFALSKYTNSSTLLNGENCTPHPSKAPIIKKILIRTLKMFLIGVLLHAWDMWIGGKDNILQNLRIWGVLERIAICYCMASLLFLYVKPRLFWPIILVLILGYCGILYVGNGYAQDETNVACIIDRALLGTAHLYHKSPIDPEGLLGTLPAIAHTLIGVVVGSIIRLKVDLKLRLAHISLLAVVLLTAGILLSFAFPLNKRIWSPSYVLVTCALAALMLTLLTYFIDVRGQNSNAGSCPSTGKKVGKNAAFCWYRPCQWFGMNAIVLYVVSEMLAPVMGRFEVGDKVYDILIHYGFSPNWASVSYAICFVLVMTLLAWVMYAKKIFVKL